LPPEDNPPLAVAPDGTWLASADQPTDTGGTVRIWETATGYTRHMLVGHTGEIRALVVASDGSWLASADSLAEGGSTVRIWNPRVRCHVRAGSV
jgi:WD40 repeat protein